MKQKAAIDVGRFELDLVTEQANWNAELHRIWGIPEGTPDLYKRALKAIAPVDKMRWQQDFEASLRPDGDRCHDIIMRIRPEDTAGYRMVHATGRVEFDGDVPVRMRGGVVDLTQTVLPLRNEQINPAFLLTSVPKADTVSSCVQQRLEAHRLAPDGYTVRGRALSFQGLDASAFARLVDVLIAGYKLRAVGGRDPSHLSFLWTEVMPVDAPDGQNNLSLCLVVRERYAARPIKALCQRSIGLVQSFVDTQFGGSAHSKMTAYGLRHVIMMPRNMG